MLGSSRLHRRSRWAQPSVPLFLCSTVDADSEELISLFSISDDPTNTVRMGDSEMVDHASDGSDSSDGASGKNVSNVGSGKKVCNADIASGKSLSTAASGKTGRKRTSKVWRHFSLPALDDENKWFTVCMHCKKKYCGDVNALGTSSMRHHIDRCQKNPDNDTAVSQKKICFVKSGFGNDVSMQSWRFDQSLARVFLAKMLVKDELPFRHVEGEGFRDFVNCICPMFRVPSRTTSTRDVYDLYDSEKSKLHALFANNDPRICLTTDTWTSVQQINYMCLTAHFIDSEWRLNKKIINFCPISSHKGEDIGKAIENCLFDWGLKNVLTVTVDNASANDTALAYLKKKFQKNSILGGKFMHMRCIAHIINLIVSDGISKLGLSVERIRYAVRFVKQSPNRIACFKNCAKLLGVDTKSGLCLDVPTRWNSTYLMLLHASKFEKVFEKFDDAEPHYKIEMNGRLRKGHDNQFLGVVCDDDWSNVKSVMQFLSHFYDLTVRVSGSLYTTSNMILDDISDTYSVLNETLMLPDNDMSAMAFKMIEKYDKYWGDASKMNLFIFIARIFDPRYKLAFVHYVIKQLYPAEHDFICAMIDRNLNDMFCDYCVIVSNSTPPSTASPSPCMSGSLSLSLSQPGSDSGPLPKPKKGLMAAAFKEFQSSSQLHSRSELDRYLKEDLEVCNDTFDILLYWKNNCARFPVVSKMAKDLLAIPISTVSSESAFSTGGRVLTDFRSSLSPKVVECLVCTQDWIRRKTNPIKLEDYLREIEEIDEDLEEYIKCKEKEKEEKEKLKEKEKQKERDKEKKKAKEKGKGKAT